MKLRIKEVAKMKGVTIKSIATKLDVLPNTISYYHKGKVLPPLNKLQSIADILNCDITELIPTGKGFAHFYVDNEYQGIRKI